MEILCRGKFENLVTNCTESLMRVETDAYKIPLSELPNAVAGQLIRRREKDSLRMRNDNHNSNSRQLRKCSAASTTHTEGARYNEMHLW